MTIQTKVVASAAIITLKGKGKAQREMAFLNIAPLSFVEAKSRTDTIANMRVALGNMPTDNELRIARDEWIIGRVANRLPAGEFPKGTSDNGDKLEFARNLVVSYAAPPKEGQKARKLRKGQTGRRSATQHKVVRAAEEAWSQVKAELGFGAAKTQAERNKTVTRAPAAAGSTARGKAGKSAPPTHSALLVAPKPMTADEAHAHLVVQMTGLMQYCSKHAKLIETGFSMPVITCHKALIDADAKRRVRIAAETADKK